MNTVLLPCDSPRGIILLFLGWGTGLKPFLHLRKPGYDILLINDFRSQSGARFSPVYTLERHPAPGRQRNSFPYRRQKGNTSGNFQRDTGESFLSDAEEIPAAVCRKHGRI